MHHHEEVRILPYQAAQIFDLVADVSAYHEFLPWCIASKVNKRTETDEGEILMADLVIGYKMFREKFTSKVHLYPHSEISVHNVGGPFRVMKNNGFFKDLEDGSCEVYFKVEFEFKSAVLDKVMGMFFAEAVKMMVSAFEKRAEELYRS